MNSLHRVLINRFEKVYQLDTSSVDKELEHGKMSNMKKAVILDELEWGQIIDGLSCRVELYENTVRYYEEGYCEGEIAEVSGENEARKLVDWYRVIIQKIQMQTGVG